MTPKTKNILKIILAIFICIVGAILVYVLWAFESLGTCGVTGQCHQSVRTGTVTGFFASGFATAATMGALYLIFRKKIFIIAAFSALILVPVAGHLVVGIN